jgi:hypothetical protein
MSAREMWIGNLMSVFRPQMSVWRKTCLGRAMAQAVSRRPPTAEAQVRFWVSPCGICGGQSGTGTGFSPSSSVFSYQFHSTGAPLLGKGQKKTCLGVWDCGQRRRFCNSLGQLLNTAHRRGCDWRPEPLSQLRTLHCVSSPCSIWTAAAEFHGYQRSLHVCGIDQFASVI